MRVLVLHEGWDTGGQGARIREAFAREEPDWHVDALAVGGNPFGYPDQHAGLGRLKRRDLVPELYRMADVLHVRNTLYGQRGKPTVLHHHGTKFRTGHTAIARQAAHHGAVQVASTLDLTLLEPGVEWCPSPYALDALGAMRRQQDGPLRIAHFPTSVKVKSSAAVAAAIQGLPVQFVHNLRINPRGKLREHTPLPWHRVLELKATADIYVDQLMLGYGNNAIEAWGMGIPVIAGTADRAVREVMLDRFGQLPFVEATVDTLPSVLRRLVESPAMRAEYGALGKAHAERWHSGAETVSVLRDAYQRAGLRQLRAVA